MVLKKNPYATIHTCPHCEVEFTDRKDAIYCSRACRTADVAKKKTKGCAHCGVDFVGRKEKRFCSKECASNSLRKDAEEVRKARKDKAKERNAIPGYRQEQRRKAKGDAYRTREEWERDNRLKRLSKAQTKIDNMARMNAYQAFKWWLQRQPDDVQEMFRKADRKVEAKRTRDRYRKDPEKYRLMKKLHKHSNPDYVTRHHARRGERMRLQSDGTVTRKALMSLLKNEEHCAYCERFVELGDRSPDHAIPLAKGGLHSMSNLVMACIECNTRKGTKDIDEFKFELLNEGLCTECAA